MDPKETLKSLSDRLEAHEYQLKDSIADINPDTKGLATTLANLQGQLQIIRGYRDWLKRNMVTT